MVDLQKIKVGHLDSRYSRYIKSYITNTKFMDFLGFLPEFHPPPVFHPPREKFAAKPSVRLFIVFQNVQVNRAIVANQRMRHLGGYIGDGRCVDPKTGNVYIYIGIYLYIHPRKLTC